jgi:Zn-dependent peptidase ImmA (M78 family)
MDAALLASQVREYLGLSVTQQIRWRSPDDALANWREAVQECGVFVFKRSFKQADVSGFCLVHEEFPVIYLNNSTAAVRQVFTLFHELAHLLLDTNGVTKLDDGYINELTGTDRDVEIFCNRFAAEFLVPREDFEKQLLRGFENEQLIAYLARRYNVSREVILRRLVDREIVSSEYYETKVAEWAREHGKSREGSGGDYYLNQYAYLGPKYLDLAFSKYYQGQISLHQLADHLNIRASNVEGLEQLIFRKAAPR